MKLLQIYVFYVNKTLVQMQIQIWPNQPGSDNLASEIFLACQISGEPLKILPEPTGKSIKKWPKSRDYRDPIDLADRSAVLHHLAGSGVEFSRSGVGSGAFREVDRWSGAEGAKPPERTGTDPPPERRSPHGGPAKLDGGPDK